MDGVPNDEAAELAGGEQSESMGLSISVTDLIITVAYFSIPIQILFSLWLYPRLANMPRNIFVLVVLFAFFVFLCGAGHLLRCLARGDTYAFVVVNNLTAGVSLITAIYLIPLTPTLLGSLDQSLQDLVELNEETTESKYKLFTFMAFLCHEIRNPLFAITSSASFLGDTEMTEEQEVGVGSIFDSSLLMLRLVNDVLDLSKIDAGKLELEERDFDLHRLLENLVYNMRMQVSQKHDDKVAMRFSMAADVPHVAYGDSVRMLQIIYNLLSNSSKFTSEGHIDFEVSVAPSKKAGAMKGHSKTNSSTLDEKLTLLDDAGRERDEGSNDSAHNSNAFSMALLESAEEGRQNQQQEHKIVNLSIVVSDTGIGIDADRVNTIFEPYSQAKLSTYRKHGGTGLGLSIVSSLIKLMGGSIEVSSVLGVGSRFALTLPVKVSHNQSGNQLEDSISDMTDPFLSCRRLPVYAKSKSKKNVMDAASVSADIPAASSGCTDLHSDDAGIKFFDNSKSPSNKSGGGGSGQSSLNPSSTDNATKTASPAKKKPRKPKLPSFDLPQGTFVLVVDDNCVNRKIIGKMLTFFNVDYKEAVNGQEAVDAVLQSRNANPSDPSAPLFELVFMDLSMPVLDGYDAIEAIRKANLSVPIVALTANALSQERERALGVGANEFHTKPILRNDLHAICVRFLQSMQPMQQQSLLEQSTPQQDLLRQSIVEETVPEMTGTDSEHSSESSSSAHGGSTTCNGNATVGDAYREGFSLMLRHDSVVAPV